MLIGELSKRSGFSRDTIRYYEKLGILVAGLERRADSSYKNYPMTALGRLRQIRRLKDCGFTLFEIGRLLTPDRNDQACTALPAKLTEKIGKIDKKIRELSEFKALLLQIERSCNGNCSTLDGMPACIPSGSD